jgi:tetratricopeptide (TPR) repeat protein
MGLRPGHFQLPIANCQLAIGNWKSVSQVFLPALVLMFLAVPGLAASADALFREGLDAYRAGDYARAARAFSEAAGRQPASGTLQNLGNAQWQRGQTGPAILAWEQALWLDPFNRSVHHNLRFARKLAQVEPPDLSWYEVVSTWLPANWWAWIAGASLWLAVGMVLLPGLLRRRKAAWHQAVAAFGLMVFLLSLPAHLGVHTRARIGFVLQPDTPLRLTPTREAQVLTRLSAGEPARWERTRGRYLLLRTSQARGWLEQDLFRLICPP